ncbi:transposase [Olsenella uli]|nr:transposase [Olsenella uli]
MYSKDDVELALPVVREGMSRREAAELAGCGEAAVLNWAAGRLPRSCAPSPRIPGEGRTEGARMCPRGVYDSPATGPLAGLEPAQMENILLRAVLADLKAVGWGPGSISSRSKCELGERLRLATGLPLRSITGFLRISRSSYECRRARLGRDRHASLRAEVRRAFEAGRGAYGYRRVHAELRRRGTRVSEKVVRRLMREEGLEARRPRRRRLGSYEGETDERLPNLPRERAEARRAAGEGLFGTFRTEFLEPLDRAGVGLEELREAIDGYMEWYGDGRLKRFEEPGGGRRYETISGRRRRLGVPL